MKYFFNNFCTKKINNYNLKKSIFRNICHLGGGYFWFRQNRNWKKKTGNSGQFKLRNLVQDWPEVPDPFRKFRFRLHQFRLFYCNSTMYGDVLSTPVSYILLGATILNYAAIFCLLLWRYFYKSNSSGIWHNII